MLGERDKKLESLGYPLDRVPGVGAIYKPVVVDGTTAYTSASAPLPRAARASPSAPPPPAAGDGARVPSPGGGRPGGARRASQGKVPSQVSVEEAKRAAALCAANVLRNVRQHAGAPGASPPGHPAAGGGPTR